MKRFEVSITRRYYTDSPAEALAISREANKMSYDPCIFDRRLNLFSDEGQLLILSGMEDLENVIKEGNHEYL